MAGIKLERLPERTPVKVTVTLPPDLHRALSEYAAAYEAASGQPEPVAELVPASLAAFLESDREFARARRSRDGSSCRVVCPSTMA